MCQQSGDILSVVVSNPKRNTLCGTEKKDNHDSAPPRLHPATTHAHHYYMVYIAAVYKGDGASCASLHYRRRIAP